MKCPKCNYLGFETGDRCKNCGYDFSLLALADPAPAADLALRPESVHTDADSAYDVSDEAYASGPDFDLNVQLPQSPPPARHDSLLKGTDPHRAGGFVSPEAALPLFPRVTAPEDEPLVKAAAPRAPLAVRRTPEIPRIKPAERAVRNRDEAQLRFMERPAVASPIVVPQSARAGAPAAPPDACEPRPRAAAAGIDAAVLIAIDLIVVYLTLRVAGLTTADWRLLPPWPLLVFLALVKVAYFSAFAAVGGQTIGKMATHIRVVTEDGGLLTPSRAIQRTLAATVSIVTLGAAFVPALVGARRALHDRVAGTRVVGA
ncbi:MAG TPA: RDD family protein [Vicinamibacterales bacterium]|nr:RDD family protein [Vicinamibacterales bacterium]